MPRHCRDQAISSDASSSPAEQHAQEALAQGARFAADLAIARWSGHDHPAMPARAAWFARAQRDFQSWLEQGGFHGE